VQRSTDVNRTGGLSGTGTQTAANSSQGRNLQPWSEKTAASSNGARLGRKNAELLTESSSGWSRCNSCGCIVFLVRRDVSLWNHFASNRGVAHNNGDFQDFVEIERVSLVCAKKAPSCWMGPHPVPQDCCALLLIYFISSGRSAPCPFWAKCTKPVP
jgi:hypothetical protein